MEQSYHRRDGLSPSRRVLPPGPRPRNRKRRRPALEPLETRELLSSITEFASLPSGAEPQQIAYGDGYLWIAEFGANAIAQVDPSHPSAAPVQISQGISASATPSALTVTTDDGLNNGVWFTEPGVSQIGVYNLNTKTVTEFQLPLQAGIVDHSASPVGITVGPDGNIWFTEQARGLIGMINANVHQTGGLVPISSGDVTLYSSGSVSQPAEIISADNYLWFTSLDSNQIGKLNPSDPNAGVTPVTIYLSGTTPTSGPQTLGIALGSDGNLWVGERNPQGPQKDALARINPNSTSQQTQFAAGGSGVYYVTAGADGNIWFTQGNEQLGMIDPASANPTVQESSTNNVDSETGWITSDPDGNIWFTDQGTEQFGLVTPTPTPTTPTPTTPTPTTPTPTTPSPTTPTPTTPSPTTPTPTTPSPTTPTPTTPSPTTPSPTTPSPTTPTILAEQINLIYQKHNKKGKPIGKPVVSFVFQFSTAMDAGTAGNAANYQVAWTSTKKVKKKVTTVFHPIGFTPSYNAATDSVTLTTSAAKTKFAKGGQVTILGGVDSAAGAALSGTTVFTVFAGASGIS